MKNDLKPLDKARRESGWWMHLPSSELDRFFHAAETQSFSSTLTGIRTRHIPLWFNSVTDGLVYRIGAYAEAREKSARSKGPGNCERGGVGGRRSDI